MEPCFCVGDSAMPEKLGTTIPESGNLFTSSAIIELVGFRVIYFRAYNVAWLGVLLSYCIPSCVSYLS